MQSMTTKVLIICAAAVLLSVVPYSIQTSKSTGIRLALDEAQAVIGRPATPGSVAGVARRTTRRHMYYGHGAYHVHPHGCAWVNGVHVCR